MRHRSDQKTKLATWWYPFSIEPVTVRQLFLWLDDEAEIDRAINGRTHHQRPAQGLERNGYCVPLMAAATLHQVPASH